MLSSLAEMMLEWMHQKKSESVCQVLRYLEKMNTIQ